jgi:hypothetical protein
MCRWLWAIANLVQVSSSLSLLLPLVLVKVRWRLRLKRLLSEKVRRCMRRSRTLLRKKRLRRKLHMKSLQRSRWRGVTPKQSRRGGTHTYMSAGFLFFPRGGQEILSIPIMYPYLLHEVPNTIRLPQDIIALHPHSCSWLITDVDRHD